jgi:cell division protein ZapA
MAEVRLSIANREYIVTCNDGEEERLQTLGAMVDEQARAAGGATGNLNESRLLLFSALLLADKLHDGSASNAGGVSRSSDDAALEQAAQAIERLAERLEKLATQLEN